MAATVATPVAVATPTAAATKAEQAYATLPDGTEVLMRALIWNNKGNVKMQDVHKPAPGHPVSAVIKITGTSVCGADMRLYNGEVLKLKPGDVMGHEAVGIVESVGSNVTHVKPGDRVVASFFIACGQCNTCLSGRYTACEALDSPLLQDVLYGSKDPRKTGFSHLSAFTGCQAEYARIPFADFNLTKVTQTTAELPDEQLITLSDVVPTAYHAVLDSRFESGQTAVIFGAGPIGITIAQWLKTLGAKRIMIVDTVPARLNFARTKLAVETLNVNEHGGHSGTAKKLRELEPSGWAVAFDATGFRYKRNLAHKIMRALSLDHPVPEVLNAAIEVTRLGGAIEVIGDYVGASTGLDIALLIEKGIALKGIGQTPTQRYMRTILDVYVVPGLFDSTLLLTHRFSLEDLPELYKWFNTKRQALSKEGKDASEAAVAYKAFVQTRSSAAPALGSPALSRVMDVGK